MHIASYPLTFLAYYPISITFIYVVLHRLDLPCKGIFLLLATLLLSCYTKLLLKVRTLWYLMDWESDWMRAVTALMCICMGAILVAILPKLLALPNSTQLESANSQLTSEILERKRIEEELRASQQMLQLVMDNIPQSIFWKDRNSVFLGCNRNFAQVAGVGSPENIVRKTDYDLPWKPEEAEFYRSCDTRVMQTNTPEYHILEPLQQADGKQLWLDTNKVPLHDSQGNVIGILGTFEDITDRRQTQDTLHQEQEFLRALLDNLAESIMACDAEGVLTRFNRVTRELHGLPEGAISVEQWIQQLNLYLPDGETPMPKEQLPLLRALQGETVRNQEIAIVSKHGESRTFLVSGQPIIDTQGKKLGAVVVRHDITECKQAREAIEKANQELELKVEERTALLKSINEKLQIEIKERVATQEALQATNQILQTLLRASPIAIDAVNTEGNVTLWNPAAERLFGWSEAEVLGRPLPIVPCDQQEEFLSQLQDELHGEVQIGLEVSRQRKDGSSLALSLWTAPLFDANATVIGSMAMFVDLSERVRSEQALRENKEQLQAIIDNSPAVIYLIDPQNRHLLSNRGYQNLLSQTDEQLKGKSLYEVWPGELADTLAKTNRYVLESGTAINLEEVLPQDDGLHTYITVKFPLYDANGILYAVCGISTDITSCKQAEAALRQSEAQLRQKATELEQALHELQQAQAQLVQSEKMSSLGQLVAGVAHEINNPLSFIHGNLDYLNLYSQDLIALIRLYRNYYPNPAGEIQAVQNEIGIDFIEEDLPKLVSSMKFGADRIGQIVRSLRNFSRTEQAEKKRVDIHEGLDSTLLILDHRLKAKANQPAIQVIKEYGNLPLVQCYPGQLNQVFMNILNNAIDVLAHAHSSWYSRSALTGAAPAVANANGIANRSYSEDERSRASRSQEASYRVHSNELSTTNNQQSPTIWIGTEVTNTNHVLIRIADNGSGITEEVQQRVFDPFFTTKPVGQGAGLGLSISYQIVVEKHGGQLQCSSRLDGGTEFLIYIPIQSVR